MLSRAQKRVYSFCSDHSFILNLEEQLCRPQAGDPAIESRAPSQAGNLKKKAPVQTWSKLSASLCAEVRTQGHHPSTHQPAAMAPKAEKKPAKKVAKSTSSAAAKKRKLAKAETYKIYIYKVLKQARACWVRSKRCDFTCAPACSLHQLPAVPLHPCALLLCCANVLVLRSAGSALLPAAS